MLFLPRPLFRPVSSPISFLQGEGGGGRTQRRKTAATATTAPNPTTTNNNIGRSGTGPSGGGGGRSAEVRCCLFCAHGGKGVRQAEPTAYADLWPQLLYVLRRILHLAVSPRCGMLARDGSDSGKDIEPITILTAWRPVPTGHERTRRVRLVCSHHLNCSPVKVVGHSFGVRVKDLLCGGALAASVPGVSPAHTAL